MKLLAAVLALLLSGAAALAQSTVATTTNSSVVIATGNTFQTVLAAITSNNQRRSLTIQNNNLSDNCWLFIGAGSPTKPTSMLLLAGAAYTRYYPYIPNDVIQATCATNGDSLYVDIQ